MIASNDKPAPRRWRMTPLIFLAAVVAATMLATRAPGGSVSAPYSGRPEIVAATFASAWCSSCKILEPRLAKVIPGFAGAPVAFVELDFTFGDRPEIRAIAQANGIEPIYDRNKGATGFTLIVDRDTGEILDTLTINFSESAIKAAIAQALSQASATPAAGR